MARYCEATGCLDDPPDALPSSPPASNASIVDPSYTNASDSTSEEPVLGVPRGAAADIQNVSQVMSFTKDGSCGASFGGVVCGNWSQGSCCSMYGYCGNRYWLSQSVSAVANVASAPRTAAQDVSQDRAFWKDQISNLWRKLPRITQYLAHSKSLATRGYQLCTQHSFQMATSSS